MTVIVLAGGAFYKSGTFPAQKDCLRWTINCSSCSVDPKRRIGSGIAPARERGANSTICFTRHTGPVSLVVARSSTSGEVGTQTSHQESVWRATTLSNGSVSESRIAVVTWDHVSRVDKFQIGVDARCTCLSTYASRAESGTGRTRVVQVVGSCSASDSSRADVVD